MNAQEAILKIKALFEDNVAPVEVEAEVAPMVEETKVEMAEYSLMDGTKVEISSLEIGGSVTLADGTTAPMGEHELMDGTEITLDENGIIIAIESKVEEVLATKVHFAADCIGESNEEFIKNVPFGEVVLLENLRFYPEEEKGDLAFAEKLSKYGDIYVNDAFGTAHRAHASTTIIAKFFPNNKCFGYLLAKEIESIERVLKNSEKPVTAILGGSKVSSKITVIENILDKIDHMIIGGGMTFTFVKALGGQIGNSICEDDKLELALEILEKAKQKGVSIHIPVDVVAADAFDNLANTKIVDVNEIPDGWQGLDAGPKTLENFGRVILNSKTILWNGPVGVFEMENFSNGTITVGNQIAEATANGAFSLVGGGDSVSAVKQFGLEPKMSYVSTGGGAMLEMLEGRILPGIAAILD